MKRIARQAVATVAVGARLWPIVGTGQAAVLRYHRVGGTAEEPVPLAVTPEEFDAQLAFLKARCQVVRARDIAEAVVEERPLPDGAVAITFDDGYEDNFSAAFPLLKKHDLTATFFVCSDWIEGKKVMWWDRLHEYVREAAAEPTQPIGYQTLPKPVAAALAAADLSTPAGAATLEHELAHALRGLGRPIEELDGLVERIAEVLGAGEAEAEPFQPMNWMQVELLREGGMDVGSHTAAHARLTTVPAERAFEGLSRSKQAIEERLGQPIALLAYPAGDHNQDVMDLAMEAGYEAAFTTETGPVRAGDDPFALRRIGVWSGGYQGALSHFSAAVFGLQIGRLARRR